MRFFSPDARGCRRRYRNRGPGSAGLRAARRPAMRTIGHYADGGVSAPERSRPAAIASLFGDTHVHGEEEVRFYTGAKAVTSRRPHVAHWATPSCSFPISI